MYHTDDECDSGGFLHSDECPNNQYPLRAFKEGLLKNVGNVTAHSAFDTTVVSPNQCSVPYDVWSTVEFGDTPSLRSKMTELLVWPLQ
jgi:hypothetical protein